MRRSDEAWPSHGGQAATLLARFGLPADRELLDFSANINPLGPPAWLAERLLAALDGLARYPDPDYREAREAIAAAEGVTPAQVLPTNGGAEAIFLVAAAHAGGRAAVVEPTFSEYARACRQYGLTVDARFLESQRFALDEAAALEAVARNDVLFLCRPNNPTGTLVERRVIERLLAAGLERGGTLVVDEAFVDFVTPDERLTPLLASWPNLILLRSLTKLYAIPGLRLGYLLGGAEAVARLRARQMPWSVNHLAASLVAPLLADHDFLARTRQWLADEQPRLQAGLAAAGLEVVPSRANFFLVRPASEPEATAGQSPIHITQEPGIGRRGGHLPWMANVAPREGFIAPPRRPIDGSIQAIKPTAIALATTEALFEHLLRSGILARHTRNFPGLDSGWLRLALRERADNERLLAALAEWRPA
ncbi:aminotransferase class I/II-fold pyridoxal phosphate-dependent enzyme [Halomonas kalidii]|uniref:Aminotransferase n=1 Tax=Halomonas kalidii TaxID=3043293 RepID=A0ABT6VPZ1_9GAMM|nr:aminotransferase class I/II-fold pyridoxal phosphate-dependent enzyme [Halomonas kalidii]MDI5936041.1 aminotransferase class I/II-fold pyridoxal phosphate-dependent enzyme [Halomonas kalidii]